MSAQLIGVIAALFTAAITIAAQRVVTAIAGYIVIRRSRAFSIGDRIKMSNVQGDVIDISWLQTRILEMGQPRTVNEQEEPGMWVRARQFSGRIVTVTNDKIFEEAVYNFTRDFPFLWEEMTLPLPYASNHSRAERIVLEATREAVGDVATKAAPAIAKMHATYGIEMDSPEYRVFWRLTDNWLELTVRFLVPEHGIRDIKDAMARRIVSELAAARIDIASSTFEITGLPTLHVERLEPAATRAS